MYEDIAWTDVDTFLKENEPLAMYTLVHYFPDYVKDDDMVEIAKIALWKAYTAFDDSKGYKFSTFACRCIVNAIKREETNRNRLKRKCTRTSLEGYTTYKECEADKTLVMMGEKDVQWYDREGLFERMTPRQRKIVSMREHGYTYHETGAAVGIGHARIGQELRKVQQFAKDYIG